MEEPEPPSLKLIFGRGDQAGLRKPFVVLPSTDLELARRRMDPETTIIRVSTKAHREIMAVLEAMDAYDEYGRLGDLIADIAKAAYDFASLPDDSSSKLQWNDKSAPHEESPISENKATSGAEVRIAHEIKKILGYVDLNIEHDVINGHFNRDGYLYYIEYQPSTDKLLFSINLTHEDAAGKNLEEIIQQLNGIILQRDILVGYGFSVDTAFDSVDSFHDIYELKVVKTVKPLNLFSDLKNIKEKIFNS